MRPEVLPGTYEKGTAPVPPGSCGAQRFVSGQALSEEAPSHHYRTSDKSIPHTSQTEPTSTQRPTSSFAASEAASCDHNDDFCNVACLVLLVCPFAFEPIFAPVLAPLIKGRSTFASQYCVSSIFCYSSPAIRGTRQPAPSQPPQDIPWALPRRRAAIHSWPYLRCCSIWLSAAALDPIMLDRVKQ